MAASCYSGALAGGMDKGEAKALEAYGLHLGMAFQLKDDLLDYRPAAAFGKAGGQDLRRGILYPARVLRAGARPTARHARPARAA